MAQQQHSEYFLYESREEEGEKERERELERFVNQIKA
jgi:hypothetical protein